MHHVKRLVRAVLRLPQLGLMAFLRFYRTFISPLYGPTCRYYPSCSAYALTAVRRHGAIRGSGLALWRLLRCNPWSRGGVDDVPPARGEAPKPQDTTSAHPEKPDSALEFQS